jgi:Niemann-Pick C1 protein
MHAVQSIHSGTYCAGIGTKAPKVYVYSVFHPFFEQFVAIKSVSVGVLVLACTLVLMVAYLFTRSVWLSVIMGMTLASLLLDIAGLLPLCGVQLNAVSLVNLSMCAGIGLEFIAHIAHAFMKATGTRCDNYLSLQYKLHLMRACMYT